MRGDEKGGAGTRVLHVTESAVGGVDLILDLMRRVALEHGIEDHFILPNDSELKFSDTATVRYFRLVRTTRLLNLLPMLALTLAAMLRLRPQIIWLHSSFAGLLRAFLWPLRLVGVRVIYCPHGWAMDRPKGALSIRVAEWILSWLGSAIHCISSHEMAVARSIGIPERKLFLLNNALPEHRPCEPTKQLAGLLRVLFVGRFDHQKGVDRLLAAYEQVLRPDLHLTLIGDFVQDRNPSLAERISRLERQGKLTWLGWQSREVILKNMSAAHCLLVPSRWEGFGLVAIESLACGTPVVATSVGGLSEIVTPDVGWLVDDETGLLERLNGLNIEACQDKYSSCLNRFSAYYSQRAYSQRYIRTLESLLA